MQGYSYRSCWVLISQKGLVWAFDSSRVRRLVLPVAHTQNSFSTRSVVFVNESPYNIYVNNYIYKNWLFSWCVFSQDCFKLLTKWLLKCGFFLFIFPSMLEFYSWLIFHSSLSSSPEAKGVVGQSFPVSVLGIYFHLLCKETQTNTKKSHTKPNCKQKPYMTLTHQCMII